MDDAPKQQILTIDSRRDCLDIPGMMFLIMNCMSIILFLCQVPVLDARCYQDNCLQCEHGPCTKCSYGWYGVDCSLRCVGCQSDGCEQFTGRCIQCSPGFFGDSCNIPCPVNCDETYPGATFCNSSTGLCLEGCKTSFWASQCNKSCSRNCQLGVCEQRNGGCLYGCNDGFYGDKCNKRCPENCQTKCSYLHGKCYTCKHGFYGSKCDKSCENCVDNECSYNELDETMSCTHGCTDGWTSGNCSVRCSERCKDQLCEEDGKCTACPVGYVGDRCMEAKPKNRNFSNRQKLVPTRKHVSNTCSDDSHCSYGPTMFLLIAKAFLEKI